MIVTPIQERTIAAGEALDSMLATAHDMGISNIPALRAVAFIGREEKPPTLGKIAAHVGLSSAAVTGTIDRLESQGYVERTYSREDRRTVRVKLTAQGEDLRAKVLAA